MGILCEMNTVTKIPPAILKQFLKLLNDVLQKETEGRNIFLRKPDTNM